MRRPALAVLLALVAATGAATATRGDEPKPVPERARVSDAPYPDEFKARVRASIAKAVEYVRTEQLDDSKPKIRLDDEDAYESAGAVLWVMVRAGVGATDPIFARALRVLRRRRPRTVVEASLTLLALGSTPLAGADPFSVPGCASDADAPRACAMDKALVEGAAKFLVSVQTPLKYKGLDRRMRSDGGWDFAVGVPGVSLKDVGADVSTTQMALLGLESASRCGFPVPAKTWLDALDLLLGWQADQGGPVDLRMNQVVGTDRFEWVERAAARGFGDRGLVEPVTGDDTASGAVGIVVCQDALRKVKALPAETDQRARSGIRDALAWLQENFEVDRNPVRAGRATADGGDSQIDAPHWMHTYERLLVHACMRHIGAHDWYREGAERLMAKQQADGSWGAVWWDNCFPTLFLLRASSPATTPVLTDLTK